MGSRKKKPKKTSLEGVLLLGLMVTVLFFVCSLVLLRHPAGAVLFPLQAGTALPDSR